MSARDIESMPEWNIAVDEAHRAFTQYLAEYGIEEV